MIRSSCWGTTLTPLQLVHLRPSITHKVTSCQYESHFLWKKKRSIHPNTDKKGYKWTTTSPQSLKTPVFKPFFRLLKYLINIYINIFFFIIGNSAKKFFFIVFYWQQVKNWLYSIIERRFKKVCFFKSWGKLHLSTH